MSNNRKQAVESYAEVFKALSNPNRLRIFLSLVNCCRPGTRWREDTDKLRVGDLCAGLDIAPSTVSHHIKELHRAGVIRTARRGQTVEVWIEPEMLRELSRFFADPLE